MLLESSRGVSPGCSGCLGVSDGIQYSDVARCFHDQCIAHAIEDAEDHHRPCRLIRQLDFLGTETVLGNFIANFLAGTESPQDMAGLETVNSAPIQYDNLKLANQ